MGADIFQLVPCRGYLSLRICVVLHTALRPDTACLTKQ